MRVANPDHGVAVAKAIDAEFANSASETRTQTESAFAAAFVKQMGNIEFLILAIGAVVFFTLLLVTGNTMAIAVRERTSELAVLKAIGFSDRFVLALVLAESLLIAALGGALGLWLAHGLTQQDITQRPDPAVPAAHRHSRSARRSRSAPAFWRGCCRRSARCGSTSRARLRRV